MLITLLFGYNTHLLQAEDSDVCAGVMARGGPGAYYALKNMKPGFHTAKTFCHNLFGFCEPEALP